MITRTEAVILSARTLGAALDLSGWFSAPQIAGELRNNKEAIPAPWSPRYTVPQIRDFLARAARAGILESKRVYMPQSPGRNKIKLYQFKGDNMNIKRATTKNELAAILKAGKGTLWAPIESVIMNNQRLTLHCKITSATPPAALPPEEVPDYVKNADIVYIQLGLAPYAVYRGGNYEILEGKE